MNMLNEKLRSIRTQLAVLEKDEVKNKEMIEFLKNEELECLKQLGVEV